MHYRIFLPILAFVLSVSCSQSYNQLSKTEFLDGWELLFNGNSLEGWRSYGSVGVTGPWAIEDETLKGLGEPGITGFLVTEKAFENFILSFEWKALPGGEAGVYYHVVERPGFDTPLLSGPKFQIFPLDSESQPSDLTLLTGADYLMHPPAPLNRQLKAGEWNQSTIVFDNGKVEHWLNGEKVLQFDAWSDEWFSLRNQKGERLAAEYGLARSGHIALQVSDAPCWYRKIKVKPLPRSAGVVELLFNGRDLTGWDQYGTERWFVEDSLLICESGPDKQYGYLATRCYYDDFEFSADFKQEANGNSGVFFRSFVEGTRVSGWQVEVAPPNQDTGGIYESYGRGWLQQIPDEKEQILLPGEWNRLRIRVEGGRVTTWLNEKQMVDFTDELIAGTPGRIALQIHDGGGIRVLWKNLWVKSL